MQKTGLFVEVLREYVGRSAYRPGQLAKLSGVPERTIVNWLDGLVERPRLWQDVVRVGKVLEIVFPAENLLEAEEKAKAMGALLANPVMEVYALEALKELP